jgi:hypothetical protein
VGEREGVSTAATDDADADACAHAQVAAAGQAVPPIRNLSDSSLSSGLFLIALCAAVNPNAVDASLVAHGGTADDHLSNAKYAISIARKIGPNLHPSPFLSPTSRPPLSFSSGACVFLTPEDIIEVKPKMLFTFIASLWVTELGGSSNSSAAGAARDTCRLSPYAHGDRLG